MTKIKFEASFGITKERVKEIYYPKTPLDQLMKML